MADYWVSRKKWTCKYCDVTINDDLPSRQQHEGGFRHKNNVERALKDLYRKSEQEKRDQEKGRREMAMIEKLAREAHKDDLLRASGSPSIVATEDAVKKGEARSAEVASTSTIKSAPSGTPAPAPTTTTTSWNPSDKLTAYGSAAADEARRIVAEEEERLRVASEAAEAARREGVAGEWQVVQEEREDRLRPPRAFASSRSDMDLTERQRARGFKLQEKTAPTYDDDDEEEEEGRRGGSTSLPTIKVKKRMKVQGNAESVEESRRRMVPQWTSISLQPADSAKKEEDQDVKPAARRPVGDEGTASTTMTTVRDPESAVIEAKVESEQIEVPSRTASEEEEKVDVSNPDPSAVPPSIATIPPKPEDASEEKPTNSGMFRKRKVGAGAGSKKVRMF